MRRALTVRVVKEMGVSHREFFEILPRVLKKRRYRRTDDEVLVDDAGGAIRISLAPEGERRIASMVLPTTRVELTFEGLGAQQAEAFVADFDLHFRRGGG